MPSARGSPASSHGVAGTLRNRAPALICWLKVRFLPGSPTFAHACTPSATVATPREGCPPYPPLLSPLCFLPLDRSTSIDLFFGKPVFGVFWGGIQPWD